MTRFIIFVIVEEVKKNREDRNLMKEKLFVMLLMGTILVGCQQENSTDKDQKEETPTVENNQQEEIPSDQEKK